MEFSDRSVAIEEAKKLLSHQWPRVQVSIILTLTGTASLLVSFLLLRLGLTQMVVRYPIAIASGYFVFIALIGIWLWLQRNDIDTDIDLIPNLDSGVGVSLPNLSGNSSASIPSGLSGKGGDFAGGGSGGDWETSVNSPVPVISTAAISPPAGIKGSGSGSGSSGGGGGFSGLDFDDAALIVLAVLAMLAGLLAIGYVVYIAPVLFAEVLADSLFAAGLYKSVKKARGDFWLRTVIWKTIIPAIVVLVFFSLAGYLVQLVFPDASSLGDAMRLLL